MKKLFYLACAVAIGMFASCQNDAGTDGGDGLPEGLTYMGLRIRLPQGVSPSTRAYAGKVEGWDQIETFDYYLLTADGTDIVTKGRLTGADVDWKRDTDPNSAFYGSWIVSPQVPFAVKPGEYKLIVVANCPETLMDTAPGATDAYQLSSTLTISGLARPSTDQTYTTPGGSVIPRDIVTMSGRNTDPATIIIEPNVTQQQVNMEQLNMAKLQITRVPSRVIVTSPLDMTAPIPVDNPTLGVIGSIADLNWSVAQGSNSVYVFPYLLQPNNDVNTPGYSYVPGSNYNTMANQYYDYSDLQNKDFAVQPLPATSGEIPYVAGKFLLENTHASGVDQTTSNYKQGNTAYCLIRGTFTPRRSPTAVLRPPTVRSTRVRPTVCSTRRPRRLPTKRTAVSPLRTCSPTRKASHSIMCG